LDALFADWYSDPLHLLSGGAMNSTVMQSADDLPACQFRGAGFQPASFAGTTMRSVLGSAGWKPTALSMHES